MQRIKQTSKTPGGKSKASSQTARAVLSLREMLVQGRFRPGERIREVPLAAELKVSRIPLHLALERLAHEGFLEIRPTRGFVVQRFSTEDIYDAIELRGLLEGAAAKLAAQRFKHISELSPDVYKRQQKNQFPWDDYRVEGDLTTIHVQGNVYMIHGLGGNVAVQILSLIHIFGSSQYQICHRQSCSPRSRRRCAVPSGALRHARHHVAGGLGCAR